MCGTKGAETAAANQQSAFTNQMVSQASSVFGTDSSVFNNILSAYSKTLAAGPSQQGFSQAEQNSLNSAAITNNANQFRNVAGAAKAGQAGYGGGNAVSVSGIPTKQNIQIGEASAANTANQLNEIQQANWSQGNTNFNNAGKAIEGAGSAFGNLSGVDSAAQTGLGANMANAKSKDAASNWWAAPVMGLANAGLSMATNGLSSFATQYGKNAANDTNGGSGSSPVGGSLSGNGAQDFDLGS